MSKRTFVTIGAGQVAAVAARTLRRRGFDGRIVLIGDEPYAPYQRPPLSKEFLAGDAGVDSLAILPPNWLADNNIEILTGTSVTRVDPAAGSVETASGATIAADAVLFATGGAPRTLAVPGPRPELVHHLRTIDDAMRLRRVMVPGRRLALIGAGFIGLEIAAAAAAAGVEVVLLEAADIPLGRVLGPEMGAECVALHTDNGVDVRTAAVVTAVRTIGDGVVIDVEGAAAVEADAVVIGIGITPNVSVALASGLTVENGIITDAQCRTSVPNVYAAGDVASRFSPRAGRHLRLEHFDNANKQGAAAANAMLGRDAISDEAPWFWSDQYGHNLQLVGAASPQMVIRGSIAGRDFTAFYLDDGALCGAFTIDRGEDVMVTRELLGRKVDTAALADADADLWELVPDEFEEAVG